MSVYREPGTATTLNVDVPATIALTAPTDNATEIDPTSAQFQLPMLAGEGYGFFFYDDADNALAQVFTTQGTVTASTLASRGFTFAHNTSYRWTAAGFQGVSTADDLATGATATAFYAARDSIVRGSGPRRFTTKAE